MGELAALSAIFVFGTVWFWSLIVAEFILLTISLSYEKYSLSFFSILAVLAGLYFFGDLAELGNLIWQNKLISLGCFAGYFVVGAIYALVKWWSFVVDVREKNRDTKKRWLGNWQRNIQGIQQNIDIIKDRLGDARFPNAQEQIEKATADKAIWEACKGTTMTAELLPLWKAYEKEHYEYDGFGRKLKLVKPEPDAYKARILAWIIYWPPSMLWTLLNDPIRKIGKAIYNWMAGSLKKISDHVWKDEDLV